MRSSPPRRHARSAWSLGGAGREDWSKAIWSHRMAVTAPSKIKVPETTVASPAGVPRAYNFNDFGCPASAKASFDLQRQFPKLSSLPKAPGPDAAFKSAVRGCQASSRARKHRPVHFMRSALAQLVKEAAMRRCKPKTLLEGGVGPPWKSERPALRTPAAQELPNIAPSKISTPCWVCKTCKGTVRPRWRGQ